MKYIASILLVYILFMAIMPSIGLASDGDEVSCCMDDGCSDDGTEDSGKDCSTCNPLFSCSCYSGFIVHSYTISLPATKNIVVKNSFYNPSVPSQLSYSIWQPPKLNA